MSKKKIMKTMDGNTAAAYVSYAFTDVAAIYPITPSSNMAEVVDEWASQGTKNIYGQEVEVVEMQSEGGAAGAVHGSLQGGAMTTTFTASQGLLLMIPNMYKIAGELLPCVIQVAARTIAAHALSIFGEHSDVMAARQTGFAMLCAASVQEAIDLSAVAHLSTTKSRVPFLHFFDGFRTSHEIQKVELIDYEDLGNLLDREAVAEFRARALSPENPVTRGTAQNPDIYFQAREASNVFYNEVPRITEEYMDQISELTGRKYKPFDYYGAPDADRIIIAMGSVCETIEETIDYLVAKGEKVGLVKVRLYRPFSIEHLIKVIPTTVNKIAVMDRTKEPGAIGEPLYMDVVSSYFNKENRPVIVGGRYGLSSKDTTPSQINAVYKMLAENPRHNFTIGITDDVTHLSIDVTEKIITEPEGTVRCKFWGLGSDGTVGANKQAIKIIGDGTDKYAQGYFSYDSKKSGGITISHLRFGDKPITSTYLIEEADYVACHMQSYVFRYDLLKGLRKGGVFVLNTVWTPEELDEKLPAKLKKEIAENEIQFYTINATKIGEEIGLGRRINMIMQSAFFKLANVIPMDVATKELKKSIEKAYGKKGEKVLNMNYEAVDRGQTGLVKIDVPEAWKNVEVKEHIKKDEPEFISKILRPIEAQNGDSLPVSAFKGIEDGTFENGTAAYEKRAIAINVPEWNMDNCIQCNQCSFVCPHAAIRPFLLTKSEAEGKPANFETLKAAGRGLEDYEFRIQVSSMDCTGCTLCAEVCPGKKGQKALVMKSIESQLDDQRPNWDYAVTLSPKEDILDRYSLKGSQFVQPLIEFSGACAGCGETPYIKLVTQLYGDRMMIANATGCSSIWGGSAPSTPYCTNHEGKGPAWANSLFEDNAEFGLGMKVANDKVREKLSNLMTGIVDTGVSDKEVFEKWIAGRDDVMAAKSATLDIVKLFGKDLGNDKANELLAEVEELKNYMTKKSQWIVGGDGWAYDIGYGGLDHVLASGKDVNVLVFDTEVYSNTGGQASKSTPTGAIAKFAAGGMRTKKKDLGLMQTTYGYVYVAQVSMGANMAHTIKAIKEAESYAGPSLIIAYAPCIAHGMKAGMGNTINQEKAAVDSGYWHLWRFDPRRYSEEGKNPFVLDSKKPKASFQDFLNSEVRYSALKKSSPEIADKLFALAEEQAKERYEGYVRMAAMDYSKEE